MMISLSSAELGTFTKTAALHASVLRGVGGETPPVQLQEDAGSQLRCGELCQSSCRWKGC